MPPPTDDAEPEWPDIDPEQIKDDNAKALVERADAYLKGQDDGLKAMEARMASLFGQSVTLASAAVAAAVTAFATLGAHNTAVASGAATGPTPPPWAMPEVAQALAVLSGFWLAAVIVAALSMPSQNWMVNGIPPRDLYDANILAAPPNSLRLAIARMLQQAINQNNRHTQRYSRRLGIVIGLLTTGPVVAVVVALAVAKSPLAPLAVCAAVLAVVMWLGRKLFG